MLKESLWSLLLAILIEAVSAAVSYLRDCLMNHVSRDQEFNHHPFAS